MTMDLLQIGLYLVVLLLLAIPVGRYMFVVYSKKKTVFDPVFVPLERLCYRVAGIDSEQEMNWRQYTGALLVFNLFGIVTVYLVQRLQGLLPLNPQHFGAVPNLVALNTAISFVTNTNWQAYAGESTMSYLSQMVALTVQNFLSAATGIAVVIALARGLARHTTKTIGNFWSDLVRTVVWVLIPLSLLLSIALVSQGVIQNFHAYQTVTTVQGASQTLPMGPIASQEAIKMVGTNGGGFLNANSAHPFENPTPLSNFLEMLAILLIPAALPLTFGYMIGDIRQGRVILAAMLVLFIAFVGITYASERYGNPQIAALGVSGSTAMEGKEVRYGIANSSLFATITTAASCGAVNAMHDSFTPLGGMIPLLQIMLGEIIFGGVGSGLYGMLIFVLLTVFIIGLMVGRTPEYLGKKIESTEMKMATIAVLIPASTILLASGIAAVDQSALSSLANPGPHGLSEILYAFSSAAGNNGSAFAGLNANTSFYNIGTGIAMLLGRFGVIVPVLAIAGSMAGKKVIPVGAGTFATTGLLFTALLIGVVLIVGALTYFPALALGPLVEHLLMLAGKAF